MGTAKNSEIGNTGGHGKIKLEKSQLAPHSHNGNTDKVGDHTHMGTTNVDGDHTHTGMTDPSGIHSHQYVDRGDTTTKKPAGGNQAAANNTSGIYRKLRSSCFFLLSCIFGCHKNQVFSPNECYY